MSLASDVFGHAQWNDILMQRQKEDEAKKQEAYQKYINNLMQNENYDPTAKVGFWDKITPWDTDNEKSAQINNLISAMEQEASGVDMRAFQQDNRTWGGKLADKLIDNDVDRYGYTGINKYDKGLEKKAEKKRKKMANSTANQVGIINDYYTNKDDDYENDGFIDSLFPN